MPADRTVIVRPGTATDVDGALSVLDAAETRRTGRPSRAGGFRDRTRRRLGDSGTFFFVAESPADGPVGLAAATSGREHGGTGPVLPGLCHISVVAVHPAHWGEGLGGRLVRALLAHGHARGYDRFQLFTQAGNARAQRLYESLGFVLTGRTDVSDGGEDIVHYVRERPRGR
ncbi:MULTISPECIES: GNAT family N-acetyltransferase [Streptomyces]|nr:GNAT family N-acetyltransferase [Streptomyces ruber]